MNSDLEGRKRATPTAAACLGKDVIPLTILHSKLTPSEVKPSDT